MGTHVIIEYNSLRRTAEDEARLFDRALIVINPPATTVNALLVIVTMIALPLISRLGWDI